MALARRAIERPRHRRLFALALCMTMVAAACGSDDDDEEASGSDQASTTTAESTGSTEGEGDGEDAEPCTEPDELTISMGAFDYGLFAAFFTARETGLMAEHCVDPEYVLMPGSTAATALVSGDLDMSTSSTTAMAAALRGLPVVVIGAFTEVPTYKIWTNQPDEIQSLEDLVGKGVAVQEFGDSYEELWILTFLEAGIDPTSVTYLTVGGGEGRFQALSANSVAASPLLSTEEPRMQEENPDATVLVDPAELGVRQHVGGLAASRDALENKSDAIYRFLLAIREGMLFVRDNPDEAAEIWASTPEMQDIGSTAEQLRLSIQDFFVEDEDFFSPTGSHSPEVQQTIIDVKKEYIVEDVDDAIGPEDVFDFTLIEDAFAEVNEAYEAEHGG